MNSYESTRNRNITAAPSEALIKGLAADGGLYVMRNLGEKKPDLHKILKKDYYGMAAEILNIFLPDYPSEEIDKAVKAAYSDKFDDKKIVPLKKVGDNFILELFHGPTSAFKDMALQILPHLLTKGKKLNGNKSETVILTATSGDTGKAALEGFKNVEGTKIIVFYPHNGVSKVQKAQMVTQEGSNVFVCGIDGNFDDAQTGVKKIFSDKRVTDILAEHNMEFSSANSINIGRLSPQVVYYFYAYKQLVDNGEITIGDKINFTVPTGNFGDILAGYYAKILGLPINRLICASNCNNVLFDFITSGTYNKNRFFEKTISPSMDILLSSNLERFLYYVSECNNDTVASLMNDVNKKGSYTVTEALQNSIEDILSAGWVSDSETKATIERYFRDYGYLADTHTGVALKVADEYKANTSDDSKSVVLSTASPFKFSASVYESIFEKYEADEFEIMQSLAEKTKCEIPIQLSELKSKQTRHNSVVDKDGMEAFVLKCLGI